MAHICIKQRLEYTVILQRQAVQGSPRRPPYLAGCLLYTSGTIIGTILEKTGAALTMANTILKIVGKKNSVLTMTITGYVTGIPVFCDSGFVILSPISRALASQSNICLLYTSRCV